MQSAALPDTEPYRLTPEEVFSRYRTGPAGVPAAEVDTRRAEHGPNQIVQLRRQPVALRFVAQFRDPMIVLLLAAAVATGYLGDWNTAGALVVLVLLNSSIGFAQEYRAERILEALDQLVEPISEVYRDGHLVEVGSRDLVVGDLVLVDEGDSIPADLRLVQVTAFATNDFALTGESQPTRKSVAALAGDIPLPSRHNMVYAGTTVATGQALGVVIATGSDTELGRIARLSQTAPRMQSPLQRETQRIARYVTVAVLALAALLLVVAIQADMTLKAALLFAVGFASALVPLGLPAEVSTALAQAAGVLARHRALVKQLSAVETLGATHVICTDKTGTLTRNEMTVVELVCDEVDYRVTGVGYEPRGGFELPDGPVDETTRARLAHFLRVGVLASSARLLPPDDQHPVWHILGDPTEGAILTVAAKAGLDLAVLSRQYPELRVLPFDSVRKRMSAICRQPDGRLLLCVKGAPDGVLDVATRVSVHGGTRPITRADRRQYLAEDAERAGRALRNIALAVRILDETELDAEPAAIETDLTLLGLVSMHDPLRQEVPSAVAAALAAGIRVNVVTGDNALTAEAIARQAGLTGEHGLVVVTEQELLDARDDQVLDHVLAGGTVFSRVTPEDKMRIVDLTRAAGRVVAVTGDGVNDAPALRHATIGVAMGVTGTDVAKQAAQVVLLDDSFGTLVEAIRQGRRIFANIAKGVLSCLTTNLAEFFVNTVSLVLASVAGIPLALGVLQILANDLLGEIFPIAALGMDPEEQDELEAPPRDPRAHILNPRSLADVVWCGFLMAALAIANYLLFFRRAGVHPAADGLAPGLLLRATTMTYATILICQLLNIMQRRSAHGFFTRYQFTNPAFWLATLGSVVVLIVIIYVPPVAAFFQTGPLSATDWLYVAGAAALFLAARELERLARGGGRVRITPAGRPWAGRGGAAASSRR